MTSDLTNLTYADFESERATIWSQCYCQCHVEGNFTKEEAKEIFSKTINRLKCSGKRDLISKPEVKIVSEPTCVKVENFNKTDGNRQPVETLEFQFLRRAKELYFWNQCRKEADPTYNDSEIEWWISKSIQNRLKIPIQSRYMSDPPVSDIDFNLDYP